MLLTACSFDFSTMAFIDGTASSVGISIANFILGSVDERVFFAERNAYKTLRLASLWETFEKCLSVTLIVY